VASLKVILDKIVLKMKTRNNFINDVIKKIAKRNNNNINQNNKKINRNFYNDCTSDERSSISNSNTNKKSNVSTIGVRFSNEVKLLEYRDDSRNNRDIIWYSVDEIDQIRIQTCDSVETLRKNKSRIINRRRKEGIRAVIKEQKRQKVQHQIERLRKFSSVKSNKKSHNNMLDFNAIAECYIKMGHTFEFQQEANKRGLIHFQDTKSTNIVSSTNYRMTNPAATWNRIAV